MPRPVWPRGLAAEYGPVALYGSINNNTGAKPDGGPAEPIPVVVLLALDMPERENGRLQKPDDIPAMGDCLEYLTERYVRHRLYRAALNAFHQRLAPVKIPLVRPLLDKAFHLRVTWPARIAR